MERMTEAARLMFERPLRTQYGRWHEYLFEWRGEDVIVMAFGAWKESPEPLVRIHSNCVAAEQLASIECDCREQLAIAYEQIRDAGAGCLVLLQQDGRGNGHLAMMRAAVLSAETGCTQGDAYRSLGYPADSRSYDGAVAALRALNVTAVTLLTNNPEKRQAFERAGMKVVQRVVTAPNSAERSFDDYYALKVREGHDIQKK
jgi:GTP cyclohydrolase II